MPVLQVVVKSRMTILQILQLRWFQQSNGCYSGWYRGSRSSVHLGLWNVLDPFMRGFELTMDIWWTGAASIHSAPRDAPYNTGRHLGWYQPSAFQGSLYKLVRLTIFIYSLFYFIFYLVPSANNNVHLKDKFGEECLLKSAQNLILCSFYNFKLHFSDTILFLG
jgi:hypothetical protein